MRLARLTTCILAPIQTSSFILTRSQVYWVYYSKRTILNMSSENPFKRAKTLVFAPSTKVIGTHSGTFQADEALGVWLLRQTEPFYQSRVVRSRDNNVLKDLDIVIDVGGVYNVSTLC